MSPAVSFATETLRIRTNRLLEGAEPALSLDDLRSLLNALRDAKDLTSGTQNLFSVSEAHLDQINSVYGPGALFRLFYLANSHDASEFHHFWSVIAFGLLSRIPTVDIELDNDKLHQSEELERFNSNVLQPSLSRKLYNPGRHPGYMVYGLGGPKILVSHPFRGVDGELYDAYGNSDDIASNLIFEGYVGTFLFMDNMLGLNNKIRRAPAWLLWFSLIAAHSDIVLFLKVQGTDFSPSQQREMAFTPDRVQKKLVEIKSGMQTTKQPDVSPEMVFYVGPEGKLTRDEVREIEREKAMPLIENYAALGFPRDRIIRVDEDGNVTQFPLNYPIYGSPRD